MKNVNVFANAMGEDVPADSESCEGEAEKSRKVGLPEMDGVTDAFYPRPPKAHSHHLQTADAEIANATWGVGEAVRQEYQEKLNHDATINK